MRNYYSGYYPFVVGDYLNMGDMSDGDYYMNHYTLYQKYCDSNNGDVGSGYGF